MFSFVKEKRVSQKQPWAPLQKSASAFHVTVTQISQIEHYFFLKIQFYPFIYNTILQRNPIMKSGKKKTDLTHFYRMSLAVGRKIGGGEGRVDQ